MKIASWNVNSVKVRLPHLLEFLKTAQPDVLCLQEIKCLADDFPRLEIAALGYRVDRYKLVAFVLSGTLAGLAGILFAVGNRLSGLDGVDWHTSGKVVIMSILGGIGTIFGPIVGAGVYESLDFFVSKTPIGDKTNIVMGTIFALCVLLFRRGIVGEILARAGKRSGPA